MKSADSNPGGGLCQEILAEARREREEILRRAQRDAEAILADAQAGAEKTTQEQLARAREEADRRRELILATAPVEARRLRAMRVEGLLQSVFDEVRTRLAARAGFDYREAVMGLATEAVSQMRGDAFVVKLSPEDRASFGETLATWVKQQVVRPSLSLTLAEEPAIANDGVMVEDAEQRQLWDNRLLSRLQRLWPELRQQIATQTSLATTSAHAGGEA